MSIDEVRKLIYAIMFTNEVGQVDNVQDNLILFTNQDGQVNIDIKLQLIYTSKLNANW